MNFVLRLNREYYTWHFKVSLRTTFSVKCVTGVETPVIRLSVGALRTKSDTSTSPQNVIENVKTEKNIWVREDLEKSRPHCEGSLPTMR